MNQTMELLMSRRSHRAYKSEALTQEQLDTIINAATASPSAINLQPWHFSVVTDKALITKINKAGGDAIKNSGDEAAIKRMEGRKWDIFYDAPCVIFISADKDAKWGILDSGIAVQNIVIAAESLGLGSVIIGLIDCAFTGEMGEELAKDLCFPENHKFAIAVCVGNPADDKPAHLVGENKVSIIK